MSTWQPFEVGDDLGGPEAIARFVESVRLTEICNLRCHGCYFFSEGMERHRSPTDEAAFDAFVDREVERGTNFVTVVGGEPSLELGRLSMFPPGKRWDARRRG